MLGLGPLALASTTATITVGGAGEHQISGAWDTGNITISFSDEAGHNYSETVAYGQFSTFASVASAFGAKFSNSYYCSGLWAYASGSTIAIVAKTPTGLGSITISGPTTSFALTTSGWNTSTSLTSSPNPSTLGSDVTLTAAVNPASATGTMTFYDGGSFLATTPLGSGTATFITGSLSAGSHSMTATYSGSSAYTPSTSPVLIQDVFSGQAPAPTFSPAPGTYANAQSVTINDSLSSATIYYTTNGTTPTTSSPVYSGPINVTATETIEAIAADPASGYSESSVASATYTITNGPFITNVLPSPATVATSVTITGGNFGSTTQGGTSTVTFNGTIAAPTQWSANSITTLVPLGATTGDIVVTVNGVASPGFPFIVNASCGP
ncbi:MAG: Ig-like domain repeat protein [Terracidiphilus sp.]